MVSPPCAEKHPPAVPLGNRKSKVVFEKYIEMHLRIIINVETKAFKAHKKTRWMSFWRCLDEIYRMDNIHAECVQDVKKQTDR